MNSKIRLQYSIKYNMYIIKPSTVDRTSDFLFLKLVQTNAAPLQYIISVVFLQNEPIC